MKKRIFSIILILTLLSGAAACRINNLPFDPSADTSGYIEETEAPTVILTPEEEALKSHMGEKAAFAENLYSVDFQQMITGFQRVLYVDFRDTRMLLTLLANNGIIAAEYDFLYAKWRIADLGIQAARFYYTDENGERVLLGYEEKYLRYCGADRYVYCYEDTLAFLDQDFQPLFSENGTFDNPVFGDGWFAYLSDNALKVIFPDGHGFTWSKISYEIISAELSGPENVLLGCKDLYQNPVFLDVDFVTGESIESGIIADPTTISAAGKADEAQVTRLLSETKLSKLPAGSVAVSVFSSTGTEQGHTYVTGESEEILRFVDGAFLTREQGETGFVLRLYEAETKTATAELTVSGTKENPCKISEVLPFGGGFIFADSYGEETTNFYLWTPEREDGAGNAAKDNAGNTATDESGNAGTSAAGNNEPASLAVFDNPTETGIRRIGDLTYYTQKKYPDADRVYTKKCASGIGFFLGDNAVTQDFPDYLAVPCADIAAATGAADEIEQLLNKMPDGFLEEIIRGYDGLDICICDDIQGKETDGEETSADGGNAARVLTAAAFTVIIDNRVIIVINRNCLGPATNFAHELMHVIDRSLSKRKDAGEAFALWEELNPEGFHYFMSYQDAMGNDVTDSLYPRFTPADEKALENPDVVWFADAYAKTYPMEDRARLFEYLCSGDAPEMFCYLSTHVQDKVRYLCAELRTYFTSLSKTETALWEEFPKTWTAPESEEESKNASEP